MVRVSAKPTDYCISEFGYLYDGEIEDPNHKAVGIPHSAFEYLEQCLAAQEARLDTEFDENIDVFLRYRIHKRRKAIQVRNYVGILQTPCGTRIEILPKIFTNPESSESLQATRFVLIKMLRCLRDSPFKSAGHANIADAKMPLLEVYISQFLNLVNQLVKRGIRSDYIQVKKNAKFLKGRLLLSQQIRKNAFHQERFYIEYQEYQVNRPANRLIKTALTTVAKKTINAKNQRLARELGFVFEEVPMSVDVDLDFKLVRADRSMGYYKEVLAWCQLLLKGHGPTTTKGDFRTLSLLYPMEQLFEDYVAHHLPKQLDQFIAEGVVLKTQARSEYLIKEHKGKRLFNMKPDLVAMKGKEVVCVMDTKWKLLATQDEINKYGISQTDLYQLYAYGHKYLKNALQKELILIYPMTKAFNQPLADFLYEEGFRLRVVPFDLENSSIIMHKQNERNNSITTIKKQASVTFDELII